jgi:hypothetical protein
MPNHYHAVIWIDHHQARVLHFSADEADEKTVRPDHPAPSLHHKAGTPGGRRELEDQRFLESVAHSVMDAGAVLVVGPSNEKDELLKHIERRHPELKVRIEGVEKLDHPTDGELLAYARRYVKAADRMRPQV